MSISSSLRRAQRVKHLVATGEVFPYTLGRFHTVRRAYSKARARVSAGAPVPDVIPGSVWSHVDVTTAIDELKRDAVSFGFDLPADQVREIDAFALERPCRAPSLGDRLFGIEEVKNGRLPDGSRISLAWVDRPMDCPSIRERSRDPVLWQVVTGYLGYRPRRCDVRLFWSPASDLSDAERRALAQTIDFHFDVYSFNFCYAHFYIRDTDGGSGAHQLYKGSHMDKPVRWLFGSARQSADALERYYGTQRLLTIEGPAGAGFVEDTSCYHRATAPRERDRLLLQFRFL